MINIQYSASYDLIFFITRPCPYIYLNSFSSFAIVRLFNQGIDVIEVSDNGRGVPVISRALMATKHATSKIRSFHDLYDDKGDGKGLTLGFRGEALFCLANLSQNLVVSTKTMDDTVGQKMHFRTSCRHI